MILLLAVAAGLIAGLARAWINKRPYQASELKWVWVVVLAVIPQLLAFHFSGAAKRIPDDLASFILVGSQILLLFFVWANCKLPGFYVMGLGLGLNLLVIALNRGWMPISLETVQSLTPDAPPDTWHIGERFGISKDLILPVVETRLWYLSDRFLLPHWFPWRAAYSLGDIFIAIGVFWLLWASGAAHHQE